MPSRNSLNGKNMVERATGNNLKALRSDNGGEFTSVEFENYLQKEGIKHQLMVPKCPEQNGIAERLNRTLIEMVRTMLANFKLPKRLWAEALATAVYLRNRSPTRAVEEKTPFESLTGEKPSVGHLRCAAYCHIPKDNRNKLDSKSQKCVFLGYSENRKGYRLFDIQKQKIIFSCDVIFNETASGFEKENDQQVYVQIELEVEDDSQVPVESPSTMNNELNEHNEESTEHSVTEEPGLRRSGRYPDHYGTYVNVADHAIEPATVEEAELTRTNGKEAMEAEFKSLKSNDVWELVDPPKNARVVGCKWVYKCKVGENGAIERHKARLVAQGYTQRSGLDYKEMFSPVVRFESVRTVLALAAQRDLKIHQMDVSTAFLNGELNELVYMKQPQGFVESGKENVVCKLNRSIYGLKQSPRCWNSALDKYLREIGFLQTKSDPCIYISTGEELFIIAVYVDDILLAGRT